MDSKFLLIIPIIAVLFLVGCTQPANTGIVCSDVISWGVSPEGVCQEFPTSCIPEGYTRVESCGTFLCQGIVCDDKCQGYTFLSNGSCLNGECTYASTEPDSIQCGFTQAPQMEFETKLVNCFYSAYNKLYGLNFTVKNLSDKATKAGASIWLLAEGKDKKIFSVVNKSYGKDELLWTNELNQPLTGQIFEIRDENTFSVLNYSLYYCEIDYYAETCNETNGIFLYAGDTNSCTH